MRTIYVDILITVNILIDFMLLVCTKNFLHIKVSLKRMILGSIIGGVLSLAALLPKLGFGENIILSFVSASVIIFSTFGKCKIKQFFKRSAVFFILSFCFCGIMIFIYTAFKPNGMQIYNNIVYFNINPVLLIILTLISYYILKLVKRFTKGEIGNEICDVEIMIGKNNYIFKAKVDTACNVKEPFSGDYVIIIEEKILDGFVPIQKNGRMIPFNSLGGDGILQGFKVDKLKINGCEKSNNIYAGICKNVLKGDIKAIVPYAIINS